MEWACPKSYRKPNLIRQGGHQAKFDSAIVSKKVDPSPKYTSSYYVSVPN
jgi:hypothetical protein